MIMSKPESSKSILTTVRQSLQSTPAGSSFLDLKLSPLSPEQAQEEALALLLEGDPEAWAHEMGVSLEVALAIKAQGHAV